MNFQAIITLMSQVLGRDLTPEVKLFERTRNAVGATLDLEGQQFFTKNWRTIVDFIETPEGKIALSTFFSDWTEASTVKVESANATIPAGVTE